MNNKITRSELNKLAKANGIKYYLKYNKFDLTKKLNIDLSITDFSKPYKKARTVEVLNPDGTTTTYLSINKAARALEKLPMQIYTMATNGELKIN